MPNGLYSGFESYRVLKSNDIVEALKSGIVALDTSVLLSLYRYNDETVEDLLTVIAAMSDNIFIPHQVVREFWRNRQSVIAGLGGASRDAKNALQKSQSSAISAIDHWANSVALPTEARESLSRKVREFYTTLHEQIEDAPAKILPETPTSDDALLSRIENLLDGRVGQQPSSEEWDTDVAEGERRVDNRIPPGYMDVEKLESDLPEGASGDYLVWSQLIREGRVRQKDLVLVTLDTKEDWWNKGKRGAIVGPRRELIEEYLSETGYRFFLLDPTDLFKHSRDLNVFTKPGSVEDIERVRDETPPRTPWTRIALQAVMDTLEENGYTQAAVIREAIENGGNITRERVYKLDGRDEKQMLRAFTRPVSRVTSELQEDGKVPYGVIPLLRAVYETGVKTSHFSVPQEVVDIVRGDALE